MRRRSFLGLPLLALAACGGGEDDDGGVPDDVPMARAPSGTQVVAEVQVNGRALQFMLDTGSDDNLLTPACAAALGLPVSDERVPASGGSGTIEPVPWVSIDTLAVGAARQRGARAYVVPMPEEFGYDGVLGTSFFRAFVPRFDYAGGRLGLTPAARYQPDEGEVVLPLRVAGAKPLVRAQVAGLDDWFSIDTGADDILTLFTPTVERHGLRIALAPVLPMVTGVSASGVERADVVRCDDLRLGPWTLRRPVVRLARTNAGLFGSDAWAGNLGGELWRRFTVSVDLRGGRLALRANDGLGDPFLAPRSGLAVRLLQGRSRVVEVLDASPAAEAGLTVGDVVVAVDGWPITSAQPLTGYLQLRAALQQPPGGAVQLRVEGSAGQRDARVLLREML